MRKTRIGHRGGPGISVDHWRFSSDVSIEIVGDAFIAARIYLGPRQVQALIRALVKAHEELYRIAIARRGFVRTVAKSVAFWKICQREEPKR
jgi:hypothetical protein